MKKNLLILVLFIILTFPAWKALRHPGMISGHDGEAAVFKATEFFNSLADGHFPPRWAKRLNYGLGQPTFTFSYTLPFYLTSAVMAIKNDPVLAYKLVLAVSFPIGAYSTYLWLIKRFGTGPAILGGLVYAYLPYHLVNVYARGAIGEVVAATILPLTFWAVDTQPPAVISLLVAVTVLAHPFYGMLFGLIWLGYGWPRVKKLGGVAWGYANAAFYILPAMAYSKLTHLDQLGEFFREKNGFVTIGQLIYSPWSYAGIGPSGQVTTTVQIGGVLLVLFLGWLARLIYKAKNPVDGDSFNKSVFFTIVVGIGIVMMTRISLPLWTIVTPLQTLQFPWRLLFVVTPAAVFCGTYFLAQVKKHQIILVGLVIILALVYSTREYTKVDRYYTWEDPAKATLGYRGTYTLLLEETPKWHSVFDEFNQLHKYEFAKTEKGDFLIKSLEWKTNYHKLEVETPAGGIISDKTHFWPGWKVFIDGKQTRLYDPLSPYSHGLLTVDMPAGKHIMESKLTETPLDLAADGISLVGIGAAIGVMVRSKYGKTDNR